MKNSRSASTKQDQHLQALQYMLLCKEVNRRSAMWVRQGHAWFHLSSAGHEVLAIIGMYLNPNDYVFPHYRDLALILQRGVSVKQIAYDMRASLSSSSAGRNMTGHYSDKNHHIFSIASPVAIQCLPAVGAAWSMKLQEKNNIVVCSLGESSARQGEFYEALCFAYEKKLPVIFVITDNHYGISTCTKDQMPLRLNLFDEGIYEHVDAIDGEQLHAASLRLTDRARNQSLPSILWIETNRLDSHSSSDDQRLYRSKNELAAMQDPVTIYSEKLISRKFISREKLAEIQLGIEQAVDAQFEESLTDPAPAVSQIHEHLFSDKNVEIPDLKIEINAQLNMVQTVNLIFQTALESTPNLLMFGQDIEEPKGGVFGLTKGLSHQFPQQVVNSPLAEATIIGAAVGAAATGMRPVIELQFVDFVGTAFNQIANQLATLRWRSNGTWTAPMVIYAPYGAYLPGGGIWHSQTNESLLAQIPGLQVVVPSTPEDAAGLFWSAIHGDNPTFILLPKHLLREKKFCGDLKAIPIGKANIVKSGKDLTLLTWGNCVSLAMQAVERLNNTVDVEVIDLRSIVPCDWDSIICSLEKTGRLLVVQEDQYNCSVGASIISKICSDPNWFDLLDAPIAWLARESGYIPFNRELETAVLPLVETIQAEIIKVMQ